MLHMYAYRIMELHDTLVELIETEKKERDYMRSEKQARLDRMLQARERYAAARSVRGPIHNGRLHV